MNKSLSQCPKPLHKVGPATKTIRKEVDKEFYNTFCFNCGCGKSSSKIKWKKENMAYGYESFQSDLDFRILHRKASMRDYYLTHIPPFKSLKAAMKAAELINNLIKTK